MATPSLSQPPSLICLSVFRLTTHTGRGREMMNDSGGSHGAARPEHARRRTRATPALRLKAPVEVARRRSCGGAGVAARGRPALYGGVPAREEEDDVTAVLGRCRSAAHLGHAALALPPIARPCAAASTDQVCPPFLFPCCCAKASTETLTKAIRLFASRSDLTTSICMHTNFDLRL
jgi:hypothetical protein